MSLRMAALATFIAALPLSVDAPPDSSGSSGSSTRHGETRVEAAGSLGQYGIVSRGCEGQVLSVVNRKLQSGALVVEHEMPFGVVIGVRGGVVREEQEATTTSGPYGGSLLTTGGDLTNHYVNPFAAYEGGWAGIGLGWLHSDEGFLFTDGDRLQPDVTGHVRFGHREGISCDLRYMEDVPLQSVGNVSMDLMFHPTPDYEFGPVLGFAGPYDGALIGLRGHVWFTPAAALQLRIALGGFSQYSATGSLGIRWPAPH